MKLKVKTPEGVMTLVQFAYDNNYAEPIVCICVNAEGNIYHYQSNHVKILNSSEF